MKITTKILIGLIGCITALLLFTGTAHAYPVGHYTAYEDSQYVLLMESNGIINDSGPSGLILTGHLIANDIGLGRYSPLEERNILYAINPGLDLISANIMINGACLVYLHYDSTASDSSYLR